MHFISGLFAIWIIVLSAKIMFDDKPGQFVGSSFAAIAWVVFFIWLAIHIYNVTH